MTISGVMHTYSYILYLGCDDAILSTLCIGLTTYVSLSPLLVKRSTVLYSVITNVLTTANGQTIINVGIDNICQVAIILFAQKIYWLHQVII